MKKVALAGTLGALTLVAGAFAPAHAAYSHTWADAHGDVSLTSDTTITTQAKKTIDLYRIHIADHATTTRVVFTIKRLKKNATYVQAFHLHWQGSTAGQYLDLWTFAQQPGFSNVDYTYGPSGSDYRDCSLHPTMRWRKGIIYVDVPHRCVPRTYGALIAETATIYAAGTDGSTYSSDTKKFHGTRFRYSLPLLSSHRRNGSRGPGGTRTHDPDPGL